MNEGTPASAALELTHVTITLPDGRRLVDDVHLRVAAGEFVLLVGPSGAGKSTLLKLIAGLNEPTDDGLSIHGVVTVAGESDRRAAIRRVGLVFQNHALFDEFSAVDNVQFAVDHRFASVPAERGEAAALLERLHVPRRDHIAQLSAGERQRVAVARTLAMNPPILLFDEPTTGLDPRRAAAVAELIVETHRLSHKTVIVVTHDFAPFLPYGPRLVLLDDRSGQLRDVDESGLTNYFQSSDASEAQGPEPASDVSRRRPSAWLRWLEWPGRALLTLAGAVTAPLGGWRRPLWNLRYLWHYLRMVAVGTTALYVAIAGAMLGFVFITFSFAHLPYTQITVPLLLEEFLAATGYSMFRVVVPLLIAVLVAGKCGASAAADLGARRLTHQHEAMRNLGADARSYLYGNLVIALAIAGPLLTAIGFASSCYAALVAFLMTSDDATVAVFQRNFFATVWPAGNRLPSGSGWVLVKSAAGGILIAALAYAIGSRPKQSSVDVSRDVGLTIFWASLAVLMLHALYSFIEF